MKTQTKIYIGLSILTILAIGMIGGSAWSGHTVTRLENEVRTAKNAALESQQTAANREIEAAQYKEKIDYLESKLTEIKTIARRQDEELEKLNANSRGARGDVERARRTRSIAATADQLCSKLAELGHECR